MAKILLNYGADVDTTAAGFGTVLNYAMKNGSEEIKKLLLDTKIDHHSSKELL
jgi:ankyrin repeat protein